MMERNRKLRLLVTTECPNKCPLCCNNQFNFDELKRVRDFDYDEIIITGGEPLLFSNKVMELCEAIKTINPLLYTEESIPKIYVYTAMPSYSKFRNIMKAVDGIVLTPHSKEDVDKFVTLNSILIDHFVFRKRQKEKLSLRLNLFKNIKDMLPYNIDLSLWKVKDMEWIEDCPVPQGEDFRRLPKLWTSE